MKRPLVYYCIAILLGCLSSSIFINNVLLGAALAASFLLIIFIYEERINFIIIIIFFIIGFASFYNYFNISISNSAEITVTEKAYGKTTGDFRGRKIALTGNTKELQAGNKIMVSGKFTHKINYSFGEIGEYKLNDYKTIKNTYLFSLNKFKESLYSHYNNLLGEKYASLAMSLCFGETKYLSQSEKLEFQRLGVIHAVSVSGMHLSLIYLVLEKISGIYISTFLSVIYVIFTGCKASAIRSFIMILILKFSKKVYKNYDSLSSLCMSAILILLIKPYYIFDIGFILSYLSTLGILLYYKKIKRLLYILPEKLAESLSLTLSAQLFSYPCIAFTIRNLGITFILGNIFLLPLYSTVVVLGNISLLFYNINIVFNFLTYIIKYTFLCIDGAVYFLMKTGAPLISLDFIDGIGFIGIYLSYVLYKHNFHKIRYFPLVLLFTILIYKFPPVPSVDFYSGNGYSLVSITYINERILICNYDETLGKEIIEIKNNIKANRVITNPKGKRNLYLNPSLQVSISDKYVMIKNNSYYDIIKLPLVYENSIKSKSIHYKLLFTKAYRIY
ncbi:MAG: ComEC/Rec2 family protein [Clostridiaceae bacterium]|nr:ComEC/Rec2 family protein [Clostridiaceae bacterium]